MDQGEFNIPVSEENIFNATVSEEMLSTINQYITWYREHEDATTFLFDTETYPEIYTPERWDFFSKLTKEKVQDVFIDPLPEKTLQIFDEKQKSLKEKEEFLERIYEAFTMGDLVAICEYYRDEIKFFDKKLSPEKIQFLAKRSKEHISPVDKISKAAFDGKFNNGLRNQVIVGTSKSGKVKTNVKTIVEINNAKIDKSKVKGIDGLDIYDGEVETAVANLFLNGNQVVTEAMIHYEMTQTERITKLQADEIHFSMEKLMRTWIEINATEEYNAYQKLDRDVFKANAIQAIEREVTLNGQTVRGYFIAACPLLFFYALSKGQVARVSPKLLKTPINKNREQIVLAAFLRRRINDIKGGSNSMILYSSIYEALKITVSSSKALAEKTNKVRNSTKRILDYFKDQKFIADYEIVQRKGINIIL